MKLTRDSRTCLIFAGGGTAGHIMPGLAVAEQLIEELPRLRIIFAAGGKPLERELVTQAGLEFVAVPCRPAPRRLRDLPSSAWHNMRGYLAAERLLKRLAPRGVIGLGGYASVPMASAAVRRRVPLVLLEQNIMPGRATRRLALWARAVCTSYLDTADHLPPDTRIRLTGNPIRRPVAKLWRRVDAAHVSTQRLLVLGGSGGAHSLNESVPRALAGLRDQLAGWQVVHQCGPRDVSATLDLYESLGVEAEVTPFIDDLPKLLSATGLVISRAGGTTLAELTAAAVPAVVVPYPHAADDHQLRNAERLAGRGACLVLDERYPGPDISERLRTAIGSLMASLPARRAMSAAMRGLARPEAAADAARVIREAAGL